MEVRGRTTVGGGGVLHGPASGLTRPEVEGCTFGADNVTVMEDSGESRYSCVSEISDVSLKMDSSWALRYASVSEVGDFGLKMDLSQSWALRYASLSLSEVGDVGLKVNS